jgi:prepilin-type N-terminal cleavage/methylation domain-containing protein
MAAAFLALANLCYAVPVEVAWRRVGEPAGEDAGRRGERWMLAPKGNSAHRPRKRGFTLVELLVVMAILSALAAVMLPAIQAVREASRRSACLNNQRQIALAIVEYVTGQRLFPRGRLGCDDTGETMDIAECPRGLPPEKKTAASGFIEILPQLEQQPLYDQLAVDDGGLWNRNVSSLGWYYDDAKRQGVAQRLAIFACPSDTALPLSEVYAPVIAATGSYALVQGSIGPGHAAYTKQAAKFANDGMFLYVRPRAAREIVDGLTATLMVGEVAMADTWESSNTWTYARVNADCLRTTANPLNTPPGGGSVSVDRQNGAFGSEHPHGAVFAFADGRAKFIDDEVDVRTYRAQSTIAGDELPAGNF